MLRRYDALSNLDKLLRHIDDEIHDMCVEDFRDNPATAKGCCQNCLLLVAMYCSLKTAWLMIRDGNESMDGLVDGERLKYHHFFSGKLDPKRLPQ